MGDAHEADVPARTSRADGLHHRLLGADRLDALGANQLGRALNPAIFGHGRQPGNWARYLFFNPEAQNFYADWDRASKDCVAILRSEAGRKPHDRELSALVGELATQSEEFRGLWAAHNVRLHTEGVKHFNHPIVGELELSFNRLGSDRRTFPRGRSRSPPVSQSQLSARVSAGQAGAELDRGA